MFPVGLALSVSLCAEAPGVEERGAGEGLTDKKLLQSSNK